MAKMPEIKDCIISAKANCLLVFSSMLPSVKETKNEEINKRNGVKYLLAFIVLV
jgi:hypothetical protein